MLGAGALGGQVFRVPAGCVAMSEWRRERMGCVGIPEEVRAVVASGPFTDTWESLGTVGVPSWYENGKFGIFVHWGLYSVPGFGSEWYPRGMYVEGSAEFEHHRATHGEQTSFGYKDFVEQFRAEQFDPVEWVGLFRRAGAQYVVPVGEHHDGFAMYRTSRSRWNAVEMGPRRDVIGELAAAVRDQWLVFGLSSHRAEHWWFFNGGMAFPSDVRDPALADLYGPAQPIWLPPNEQFLEDWLLRTCELVDSYQPQLVWFDWWIEQPAFEPYLRAFAAYYYNRAASWGKEVAINYKWDAFAPGSGVLDVERGVMPEASARFWQTDTATMRNSWGYVKERTYKTPSSILEDLVDVVSKNGAFLLNVGPAPDGTIPEEDRSILESVGSWMRVNGEAVYGTRPWVVHGEGPTKVPAGAHRERARGRFGVADIRFTQRARQATGGGYGPEGAVYATVLGVDAEARRAPELRLRIEALGSARGLNRGVAGQVELLGAGTLGSAEMSEEALVATVTREQLQGLPEGPLVLKIPTGVA